MFFDDINNSPTSNSKNLKWLFYKIKKSIDKLTSWYRVSTQICQKNYKTFEGQNGKIPGKNKKTQLDATVKLKPYTLH